MLALFLYRQLPAGYVVPVALLALQIQLNQVVLAEIIPRERQRPVAFVGLQLQVAGPGGGLALIVQPRSLVQQAYQQIC